MLLRGGGARARAKIFLRKRLSQPIGSIGACFFAHKNKSAKPPVSGAFMASFFFPAAIFMALSSGGAASQDTVPDIEAEKQASLQKLREDLNSRPLVARQLSRHKGAREFLQGGEPPQAQESQQQQQQPQEAPNSPPSMEAPQAAPSQEGSFESPMEGPSGAANQQEPWSGQPPSGSASPLPEANGGEAASRGLAFFGGGRDKEEEADSSGAPDEDSLFLEGGEAASASALKKKKDAHKITYKKKAVVFYRRICPSGAECHKVPVLTNLKSVIYNYNQGRFPNSAFSKP